ncbi:AAA family ATPase [Actinomadura macrotermitis]|nr:ATP-binding protein [Actinomadura macrotermitis]
MNGADMTVSERLNKARRRRFVGRETHLRLLREALEAPEPPFSVLFVHGPGGIGKTELLGAFARVAEETGAETVRVDGRTADRAVFTEALAGRVGKRLVLLIDAYEALTALDGWVREELVPGLPADTVVVIAGRCPPARPWREDAGWRELLRVEPLGGLAPAEARELLRVEGMAGHRHGPALAAAQGHPLALALLAGPPDPGAVRRLAECFTGDAPSDLHRTALQVCAHARHTTEPLLRDVLGAAAGELFAWLRGLAFVEQGPHGLYPHDLAREVIIEDLRGRDPAGFAALHRRTRAHLAARITGGTGPELRRLIDDHSFLLRHDADFRAHWDWPRLGEAHADRATPADHAEMLAMTERHEGPQAARRVARWLEHPAAAPVALRTEGDARLTGFTLQVGLHALTDAERAQDPGIAAAWAHAQAHGPVRPGEQVTYVLAFMDRERHQRTSASRDAGVAYRGQVLLSTPGLTFDFVSCFVDPADPAPLLLRAGYRRIPEADHTVGETRYAAFVLDWRRLTAGAWLDLASEPDAAVPAALTRAEFTNAVKRALRDLHAPDRLAANPLLATRPGDPQTLRDQLCAAIHRLADDPRGQRLFRTLEQTFLRPARTQAEAAEALGVPFSTYRRHLAQGTERVADLLWQDGAR